MTIYLLICILLFAIVSIPITTSELESSVKLAGDITKLLKHEHNLALSDIKQVEGFKFLNNDINYSKGTIRGDAISLINLFNFMIKNLNFDSSTKSKINDAFTELSMQIITNVGNIIRTFNLYYQENGGQINLLHINFKKNNEIENAIDYEKIIIKCDFVLANPYVIITESDSDLFSSTSTQRIEYLPANIKPEHWKHIFNLNAEILNYNETPQLN